MHVLAYFDAASFDATAFFLVRTPLGISGNVQ